LLLLLVVVLVMSGLGLPVLPLSPGLLLGRRDAAAAAAAAAAAGSRHVVLQKPHTCVSATAAFAAALPPSWVQCVSCTGGWFDCRAAGMQPESLGLLCRAL
jgi:hypothetical protein